LAGTVHCDVDEVEECTEIDCDGITIHTTLYGELYSGPQKLDRAVS